MDEFWHSFEEYIRSYLPQWRYDRDSGELEGALIYAAARLIEDSRARLEGLPQKHEVEFLRGWALEPLPPDPMEAYASLSAPQGVRVPAGSGFYASGDGTRLWRTEEEGWADSLRLTAQVLSGGGQGKLISLPAPAAEGPVGLFDFRPEGDQRQAVRFAHRDAFASQGGCHVELLLPDGDPALLEFLAGDGMAWTLLCGQEEALPIEAPRRDGPALGFDLPPAPQGWAVRGDVRRGPAPSGRAGQVLVRTRRLPLAPALVWGDEGACAGARWLPFGDTPEVWKTCCLSCPDALSLRGGRITAGFTLSMAEREELLPGMGEAAEYKPVMRRLPPPPPALRDVWADQVDWEYWNGAGWLPIPGTEGQTGLFGALEGAAAGIEVRFNWPEDAEPCLVGGQWGHWLRWRVRRAQGGGWLPRRCHAPEITNLRFSASLEGAPVETARCAGMPGEFVPLLDGREALFPPLGPEGSWWWLGFDRPPSGDLLRLHLSLQGRAPGGRLSAWEGTGRGLRPLALTDGTDGLAHGGALTMAGIRGGLTERFGRRCWWLGLRDDSMTLAQGRRFPQLEGLAWGAVRVRAQGGGSCAAGEALSPLRGGPLRGVTLTSSFGGCGQEGEEEWLRRARARRHHLGRGVSARDIDELIRGRLRDVLRTRCVVEGGVLRVGVLLRDCAHHEAAFAARREDIAQLLERTAALPALGLRMEVCEPVFYPVCVAAWLQPERDGAFEDLRREAVEALDRFLDPAAGNSRGQGWALGTLPTEAELGEFLREAVHGSLGRVVLTAVAPDGRELDCAQVREAFALPVGGAHAIHRLNGEGRL